MKPADDATMQVGLDTGLLECETCEIRGHLTSLDEANRDAWQRYRQLTGHRLTWDGFAGKPCDWWLAHVMRDVDADDLDEVMARLRVLYNTFAPPPATP